MTVDAQDSQRTEASSHLGIAGLFSLTQGKGQGDRFLRLGFVHNIEL